MREALVYRGGDRGWQPGRYARDARRSFSGLLEEQRGNAWCLERQSSTHREISDHAERVDVAAAVNGSGGGLLGTDEVRGAHDFPGIGRGLRARAAMGDAEVGDERASRARFEEDVV